MEKSVDKDINTEDTLIKTKKVKTFAYKKYLPSILSYLSIDEYLKLELVNKETKKKIIDFYSKACHRTGSFGNKNKKESDFQIKLNFYTNYSNKLKVIPISNIENFSSLIAESVIIKESDSKVNKSKFENLLYNGKKQRELNNIIFNPCLQQYGNLINESTSNKDIINRYYDSLQSNKSYIVNFEFYNNSLFIIYSDLTIKEFYSYPSLKNRELKIFLSDENLENNNDSETKKEIITNLYFYKNLIFFLSNNKILYLYCRSKDSNKEICLEVVKLYNQVKEVIILKNFIFFIFETNIGYIDFEKNSLNNNNENIKDQGENKSDTKIDDDYFFIENLEKFSSIFELKILGYFEAKETCFSTSSFCFINKNDDLYYLNLLDLIKNYDVPKLISNLGSCKDVQYKIAMNDTSIEILKSIIRKPLSKWKCDDVIEWLKKLKLEEYINVVKYEKISGRDILEGSKSFFYNIMGTLSDHYQKIQYEINSVKSEKLINQSLLVWGNNLKGHIAIEKENIKKITEIQIPILDGNKGITSINSSNDNSFLLKNDNDYFTDIKILNNSTLLISHYGEIYLSGALVTSLNVIEDNVPKNKSERRESMNSNKKDSKNKKNKVEEYEKNVSPLKKFVNISFLFSYNKQCSSFFICKKILFSKEFAFILGTTSSNTPFVRLDKRCKYKSNENDEEIINLTYLGSIKQGLTENFPTCEEFIEKIRKKTIGNETNFNVVYENNMYGILQNSLFDFLQSDAPIHKVLQIKIGSEVIWDRKIRFIKTEFLN